MNQGASSATVAADAPEIRTRRLLLRAPCHGDLDEIVEGIGDFEVSRMLARVPFPYARADAEAFLALASQRNSRGEDLFLIIEHDGSAAGGIGLHGLAWPTDFGYWLARQHWGRGLATEAARGLIAFAFDRYGFERIPSGVFHDNPVSLRVQKKLGFEIVGRRRVYSLARGAEVEHIDTVLTREAFGKAGR